MKKIILFIAVCICFLASSCNSSNVYNENGVVVIYVANGEMVTDIAVSHGGFYYMTEKMPADYVPTEKTVYGCDMVTHDLDKRVILKEHK